MTITNTTPVERFEAVCQLAAEIALLRDTVTRALEHSCTSGVDGFANRVKLIDAVSKWLIADVDEYLRKHTSVDA